MTLPLRTEPEISVEDIAKVYGAVRRWFSLPEVRRIGAHTGCSCGFPSVMADEPVDWYDGIFDDHDVQPEDLASMRALFALIDEALSQSAAIELLPVWIGDEEEAPLGTVRLVRSQMEPEKFFFTEHFLYRIERE